jgi:exodeoxyribonuclease VII large subunit
MALAREEERLFSAVGTRIERERMKLFAQSEKLKTLDPLSVLGRGFSVAFGSDGKAIKSVNDLPSGTEFELMLSDGKTQAVSK